MEDVTALVKVDYITLATFNLVLKIRLIYVHYNVNNTITKQLNIFQSIVNLNLARCIVDQSPMKFIIQ